MPAAANQGTLTLVLENTSRLAARLRRRKADKAPGHRAVNWNTGPDITAMSLTAPSTRTATTHCRIFDFAFTNPKIHRADGFGDYNAEITTDNPGSSPRHNPASFNGSQIKSPITLTFP